MINYQAINIAPPVGLEPTKNPESKSGSSTNSLTGE